MIGFWEMLGLRKPKEGEEKGKIYDSTGIGTGPATLESGSSDNFYGSIQNIVMAVVGESGAAETRVNVYDLGNGQYKWIVHLVMPRKAVVDDWNQHLTAANAEKSEKEEELAGYMEQFKTMTGIVATIHLLRKSGPAKEYREAQGELKELASVVAGLESRVHELKTYGYWVQEFPEGEYAIYPYPSVLEVTASSLSQRAPSVSVSFSPHLDTKTLEHFYDVAEKLSESIQDEYPQLDVHIGFIETAVLYTTPLSEVKGKKPRKTPKKKLYVGGGISGG